jgi:hypothetical protein
MLNHLGQELRLMDPTYIIEDSQRRLQTREKREVGFDNRPAFTSDRCEPFSASNYQRS